MISEGMTLYVRETFPRWGQIPGIGQCISVGHLLYHVKDHRREGLGARISVGSASFLRTDPPTAHCQDDAQRLLSMVLKHSIAQKTVLLWGGCILKSLGGALKKH